MKDGQGPPNDIDEYVAGFPFDVREILGKIRKTIKAAAPEAEEKISYQIPTFTLHGRNLIHFAAYKKHIGVYPVPRGNAELNKRLATHRTGKGTLQFALDKAMPYGLITKIVKARLRERAAGAEAERQTRK